jgi:hypothetical protein
MTLDETPSTPVAQAEALGHSMVWDPTFLGHDRWTCDRCGRAVVKPHGLPYGSAIEVECDRSAQKFIDDHIKIIRVQLPPPRQKKIER